MPVTSPVAIYRVKVNTFCYGLNAWYLLKCRQAEQYPPTPRCGVTSVGAGPLKGDQAPPLIWHQCPKDIPCLFPQERHHEKAPPIMQEAGLKQYQICWDLNLGLASFQNCEQCIFVAYKLLSLQHFCSSSPKGLRCFCMSFILQIRLFDW